MIKKINLYIVDNNESFVDKMEEVFFEHRSLKINVIGTAKKYAECEKDIANIREADVFLIASSLPDKSGVELIRHLRKNGNPKAVFIATVTKNTRNLADLAIEAGAQHFIQKPFEPIVLVEKIYESLGLELNLDEEEESAVEEVDITQNQGEEDEEEEIEYFAADEEEDEEPYVEEDEDNKEREVLDIFNGMTRGRNIFKEAVHDGDKPGKVVAFSSPKSVGKTSALVNTAVAIKRSSEFDPSIIILDLNFVYPSVGFKFHQDDLIFPKKNIYDLLADVNDLDEELMKEAVITHTPTKIQIIETPFETITDFKKVTRERLSKLILYLRENYDLVMIDTTGNIRDDTTIIPLTMSDTNVILFESDLASLIHTRKFVDMIKLVEERTDKEIIEKTLFILNRFNANTSLSVDMAKSSILNVEGQELNMPLHIPDEPLLTQYANNGEFIVDSTGEASDRFNELAGMLYPFYVDGEGRKPRKKENKSLFDMLKSRIKG